SDFDPKGKSDGEVMMFCQSFMTELYRHIGQFLDIPAGDTGVGAREIGYMYGQYKRICNEFTGAFTSKGISYGGSLVRTEATGYGLCYFTQEMLKGAGRGFRGSDVVISGSGNVAVFACQKAAELGAKVVAMSDSDGFVHDPGGIRLDVVRQIKEKERGRISLYADRVRGSTYKAGSGGIWSVPCSIALPCGTQNEIGLPEARELVRGGAVALAEGANMPTKPEAIEYLMGEGVLFGPGKAANAGGVTTSGLEMSQNSQRVSWTFDEVDRRLSEIMVSIHASIKSAAEDYGKPGNLAAGANIAGFLKVAEAMKAQGVAY
ncbi:MAG: NADP-specific glutamate dehydrogenase, partial [Oscillospiraceae bacterium]|nr:NADP-specific glutamate dehydrogenase [Oscillospiraceae bacterium]